MPDPVSQDSGSYTIVHTVDSRALVLVIMWRGALSLALVGAACLALCIGFLIYRDAQPTHAAITTSKDVQSAERIDGTSALIEYSNFKLTASGLGAVVMLSGVLFGLLALRARPTLKVGPRGGLLRRGTDSFAQRLSAPYGVPLDTAVAGHVT